MAATMRALSLEKYGPPSEFQLLDLPIPTLKSPDEILIKVHAASINPVDIFLASEKSKIMVKQTFPLPIGYDLSGTVVSTGADVPAHFKPGTEVYSLLSDRHRGSVAEYAISTTSATALKPSTLSHTQAASLPLVSLTALQALDLANKTLAGGLKGKTVYIPGGLSGVGSVALQLAKNVFGAKKVITTLSTAKIPKLEELLGKGVADQVVDYTKDDPAVVIGKGEVDFMFDTMGAALSSLHLMKKGGVIVSVSSLPFGPDLKRAAKNLPAVVRWGLDTAGVVSQWRARRYGVDYRYLFVNYSGDDLERLRGWVEEGKVRTVVGKVSKLRDLDAVRAGCEEVAGKKGTLGKFVVEIAGSA